MIGQSKPKPALDKISDLIETMNQRWLSKLQKEIGMFEQLEGENGVFALPTLKWNSRDNTYSPDETVYYFEWYCWQGFPNSIQLQKPQKNSTQKAVDIFTEIVTLLRKALENYISPHERKSIVEGIIENCESVLRQMEAELDSKMYEDALKYIRMSGVTFIRNGFLDLLEYREPNSNELTIRFNLKQDHLAYFLTVLMNGGLIDNPRHEVLAFAKKHFRYSKKQKNGNITYNSPNGIDQKMTDFSIGILYSDSARNVVMNIIDKGLLIINL